MTPDPLTGSRAQNVIRPSLKATDPSMHSYSAAPSPNHVLTSGHSPASERLKETTSRRSVESLCLLNDPQVSRNFQRNTSRLRKRDHPDENWGNELSTLELKPPTGFTDTHETSEAECDIDMKLKVHRKRPGPITNSLSKSPKDFTITV